MDRVKIFFRIILFVLSFIMLIQAFSGIYDFDLSVKTRLFNLLYNFVPWLGFIIITANFRIPSKTLGIFYLVFSISGFYFFLEVANYTSNIYLMLAIMAPVFIGGVLHLIK